MPIARHLRPMRSYLNTDTREEGFLSLRVFGLYFKQKSIIDFNLKQSYTQFLEFNDQIIKRGGIRIQLEINGSIARVVLQ